METKTNDPAKVYEYWAGETPPRNIDLFKGQYRESSHWTKEYIMYLKFKPDYTWWKEFIRQNHISADNGNWTVPDDAPHWFKPSKNSLRYGGGEDFDQGSRYFHDTLTGVCYIYEIQL
jgi:hypothetical protein